jgi:hypothetical protein
MAEDDNEICNCGTYDEAIETAKQAIEEAYMVSGDDHMCLMFQMMVTQAVGAICLRGLHMQLNAICKQKGDERTQAETRDSVLRAVENLQSHLGVHLVARGGELDKYLMAMFDRKGGNPFVLVEEDRTIN